MVYLKPLKYEHVSEMVKWGKHSDPRLLHYNFDYNTEKEFHLWYKAKKQFLRRYIYGIFYLDELVGFVTLKNINWIFKKAEMGIVLNPDIIGQNIGSRAIGLYLDYVDKEYKIKKIRLRVAAFNIRAIKCYKKVGFKFYKEVIEEYEDQDYLLKDSLYKKYPEFQYIEGKIYTKYYYMKIRRT